MAREHCERRSEREMEPEWVAPLRRRPLPPELSGGKPTPDELRRLLMYAGTGDSITEVVSSGYDASLEGIGNDWLGTRGSDLIWLPPEPTTAPNRRLLIHLCSQVVAEQQWGSVESFRQAILIGACAVGETEDPYERGEVDCAQQEQVSPFWHFPDAGIPLFVLTWIPGDTQDTSAPPDGPPGWSQSLYIASSAILFNQVAPYIPPAGGEPPGEIIALIKSLRYRWDGSGGRLQQRVWRRGPGRFALYCSVWQTDPDRYRGPRPQTPPQPTRIEDIFVQNNPSARYVAVGGAMTVLHRTCR
ncbi:MAG: hypothetical protein IT477_11350 [Rhodanobacteraceae bacterium]|nr:hypothetical protein [Rhodanobacteraceae bacterium]